MMSQIGEAIAVAAVKKTSPCWYCEEKPTWPPRKNDENADPQSSEAEDEDDVPENDESNESSALGDALGTAPKWKIDCPTTESPVDVGPAAHHLIPGNASLAKAMKSGLKDYMREGGEFNLASDIGYNVNNEKNGVWLPGNYGVRPGKNNYKKKWGSQSAAFKLDYANRVMKAVKKQFHDAHPKYSKNVLQTLESIAEKLGDLAEKCPVCGDKFDKTRPPYGLVGRLDGVSSKHKTMVNSLGRNATKYVRAGYYTSTRVKTYLGVI